MAVQAAALPLAPRTQSEPPRVSMPTKLLFGCGGGFWRGLGRGRRLGWRRRRHWHRNMLMNDQPVAPLFLPNNGPAKIEIFLAAGFPGERRVPYGRGPGNQRPRCDVFTGERELR